MSRRRIRLALTEAEAGHLRVALCLLEESSWGDLHPTPDQRAGNRAAIAIRDRLDRARAKPGREYGITFTRAELLALSLAGDNLSDPSAHARGAYRIFCRAFQRVEDALRGKGEEDEPLA